MHDEKVFGEHSYEVLTSSREGLQRQSEHFGTEQRHDTDGYNIIPLGYCTYRNRSDDGFFTFNVNNAFTTGIVSKFYPVFKFVGANSTFMTEYLNHSISNKKKLSILAVGTSQVVLSISALRSASFCIPHEKEQDKLASFIELLNIRIVKQRQLVELLKKYKRGVVSKLINGTLAFDNSSDMVLKRVGDFCEVQMCKRIFKEQTTPIGEVPFYKIGTIGGKPDAYITQTLYDEYRKKYSFPRKGEFLISCAGTVGKCVLYNGEDSYFQDSNIVWLRNNSEEVTNEYLYVLVSNVDWSTLNSTTITRIYNDNLRDLCFYIPSVQMQKKITSFIFALKKRIDKEQEVLEKMQQRKAGLLQRLFI